MKLRIVLLFSILNVMMGCGQKSDVQIVHAAGLGDLSQVKVLIEKGADINAHAIGDWTPLTAATLGGHSEIVKFLLAEGANVNEMEGGGIRPFFGQRFTEMRKF